MFFFGLNILLKNVEISTFRSLFQSTHVNRLVLGLTILFSAKLLIGVLAGKDAVVTPQYYLELIVLESIVRPHGFYIAHVIYYGPILLLALLFWKAFSRTLAQFGLGLLLVIIGNLILSIGSEYRNLVLVIAFFVVLTVLSLEEYKPQTTFYWIVGLISLSYSKIWLQRNSEHL